jgi:hypothetical protein
MARLSSYSLAIARTICERIANGETLIAICEEKGMPSKPAVLRWLDQHEEFRTQYAHARAKQADAFAEMILEEARTAKDAQLGRLRMDALKWAASKIAPKKYGDKVEVEHAGEVDIVVKIGGTLGPRNG